MKEFIVLYQWGEGRRKEVCFKRENAKQVSEEMETWTNIDGGHATTGPADSQRTRAISIRIAFFKNARMHVYSTCM